ncbi:MAG: hypothetical protein M3R08_02125 [Bacteroidota bacterium]|nr:hypothetical protein [Bacteroidota bacterium]
MECAAISVRKPIIDALSLFSDPFVEQFQGPTGPHTSKMAIRISFKRGIRQSQQAALYFRGIVGGLVEAMLQGLEEHHYHISAFEGPSLHLRVWSSTSLEQEELHNLMELLMNLRSQIRGLQEKPLERNRVAQLVKGWLSDRMDGADLYVELAIEFVDGSIEERPEFTLAIVRGRCAMISTDGCLFSWLEDDIFGLTLAGHGSYLLEVIGKDGSNVRQLKKAS